jgi:hypothetical protein
MRTVIAPVVVLAGALALGCAAPPAAAAPSADVVAAADRLVATWTATDGAEVGRTRGLNAEWDFLSRTFLVLSLANLAVADPGLAERYRPVIDAVLADTLRAEREGGLYHFLMPYARAKPWVRQPPRSQFVDGEVALMLGARLLLGEHAGHAAELRRRTAAMVAGMRQSPVRCAESYPDECWTFCNTTALAAIRIADVLLGADHGPFLQEWVATARARLLDAETGLLAASTTVDGAVLDGPEGSSLWWSAHMLQLVAPDLAREQYDAAKAALAGWVGPWSYAREWPAGREGQLDVDAGEIVPFLGASTGSSGLAVVGAAAFRDERWLRGLRASLALVGVADGAPSALTGGAVGQAVLLYAQTVGPLWEEVRRRARPGTTAPGTEGVDCARFERVAAALRSGEGLGAVEALDPVAFWRALEVCHASGPTLCHRSYASLRALPSMAVSDGGADLDAYEATYLAACQSLPEPVQRCLTVGYALEHTAACERLGAREQLQEALRRAER